ncbi:MULTISPECIES: hypothetical protein [unclassified Acinetobacter]|uniref:hypothetical protein n=1 Tax=unclassified Acinetobacter TaxID=196816 RepID=UPI00051B63B7|nr:hypothetical protein [Acinetobacter sp. MN12]
MIYIKRDISLIPEKVLKVAQRAQDELESLPIEERAGFIKKKAHIWRGFSKYLSKMSHGKCWYSECRDAGANFDVDHFRPKAEAKRCEIVTDVDGYAWLAFDWENFRLAAQNTNRLNKDEITEITFGKGSWFPLLKGSSKACWDDRCVAQEKPLLIDPVNKNDLEYIDFDESGRFVPHKLCVGEAANRITRSAILYGLNLEKMREARFELMQDVKDLYEAIVQSAEDMGGMGDNAPMKAIEKQIEKLKSKTRADAIFSLAARIQLQKMGMASDLFIDRSLDAA